MFFAPILGFVDFPRSELVSGIVELFFKIANCGTEIVDVPIRRQRKIRDIRVVRKGNSCFALTRALRMFWQIFQ